MPDLLLEIVAEEIPASYIPPALAAMAQTMEGLLAEARIAHGEMRTLATPRRLTIFVEGLAQGPEPIIREIAGPSKKAAYTSDGSPTEALKGFCRSNGVDAGSVRIKETGRGPYCVVEKTDVGRPTAEILAGGLPGLVVSLPFPKSMYWAERGVTFARPIRKIVALLDGEVIPFRIGEVESGRETCGHPFLAPGNIRLKRASLDDYKKSLEKAYVLADVAERRRRLRDQIEGILRGHGSNLLDEALLEEVTFMVEWPGAAEGSFDESFLDLPGEVLEESMREHQRYFCVRDGKGKLINRFIAVHNRTERHADAVRRGNERVLKARLNDARFFWDHDRRIPLLQLASKLSGVEYLKGLGSMAEKSERLAKLCLVFSRRVPTPADYEGDAERHSIEAGRICKADLLTEMVGEFPRLQGIMGGFYALEQKMHPEVALAVAEHYLPRHPKDALPRTKLGVALSLADKFDHLGACFALGLIPSGSSDPLAVRRAAAAIVRIFCKQELAVGLAEWADEALKGLTGKIRFDRDAVRNKVVGFLLERFEELYQREGGRKEIFTACRFNRSDNPTDLLERMGALTRLTADPIWPSLQELVERTYNISKPAPDEGEQPIDEGLFGQEEERAVWKAFLGCREEVRKLFNDRRFEQASRVYEAALAEPVHRFFEKVFVNVEDRKVRANRIGLLKEINLLFTRHFANPAHIFVPEEAKPKRSRR